jgi:transcriptional regulator with XRE-family HTH domain
MASLRRLSGQDFTTLCFIDAFEMLGAGKSMTQLARRTGLSRSQVYRLQKGWIEPDVWMLQTVAKAFNKHPSFFVEYRAYFVLANLQGRLLGSPESSIDLYRKLTRDQPVGEVD